MTFIRVETQHTSLSLGMFGFSGIRSPPQTPYLPSHIVLLPERGHKGPKTKPCPKLPCKMQCKCKKREPCFRLTGSFGRSSVFVEWVAGISGPASFILSPSRWSSELLVFPNNSNYQEPGRGREWKDLGGERNGGDDKRRVADFFG
ncbi:hypothetical protein PAAG_03728 [Paracoccidioides lutzii Pb01]|uniref:Uncharacterized protein n=1 Tax=Paracoccidioides lutzii (strain ATCC MYA-826 / Pb01) TaxID=502779 RepID=C1GYY4_PARBA|nr:hypothetical protein PAAG_03728 [Paracoccidioides lutzii Pb01]EEH41807.2 hypothetical protein PAAG_03728 [Paracoccidioides lutzii Pb01]